MRRGLYGLFIFICVGCAEFSHTEFEEDVVDLKAVEASGACQQRWIPRVERDQTFDIARTSARAQCSGGPQPGAVALGRFVRQHFGDILDMENRDGPVQIYNCRRVRGGRSRSVHGDGRAIDFMIPTIDGRADNAAGDRLANWLISNAEYIGVQYIIWDRTKWHPTLNRTGACYGGSHDHANHIHVELTWAAANQTSPFFRDLNNGNTPVPMEPDVPDSDLETPQGAGWIGANCERNEDCGTRSDGRQLSCVLPPGDHGQTGMCTTTCAGYCPDRAGSARTFCIAGWVLGQPDPGLCVAQSENLNDACVAFDDRSMARHWRYLGDSSASARQADVCVFTPHETVPDLPEPVPETPAPREREPQPDGEESSLEPESAVPDEEPNRSTPEEVAPSGNEVCRDTALPLSDHGRPCAGIAHNTWRCACSARFEESVSQVCRDGAWINYELNPRDCTRCDGRYTQGCEP